MIKTYFTGDKRIIKVQLLDEDGNPLNIPTDSEVLCAFRDSAQLLAGPWEAQDTHPDADWSIGLVAFVTDGTVAEGVTRSPSARIEVQITSADTLSIVTYLDDAAWAIAPGVID